MIILIHYDWCMLQYMMIRIRMMIIMMLATTNMSIIIRIIIVIITMIIIMMLDFFVSHNLEMVEHVNWRKS